MMGEQKSEAQLFNYAINVEKRVRSNHPLRQVKGAIDFGFVREEVAHCYGKKGNEAVAPEVILKMMFLLFFDDIKSERELMEVIGERLDYLWFLDYGLDEKIPDHSVLSKARARWGKEVFESLFVRTVAQCVEAGLMDGNKLHVDSSLVDANAAKESVIKGAPSLIAALKRAYAATESKLEETSTPENYQAVNDRMMSQSDPDAAMVRKGSGDSRPRYQHHRAIDDAKGVITAVETTPGSIAENKKLMDLVDQHEKNTRCQVQNVVADHKYGTSQNYVACGDVVLSSRGRKFPVRRSTTPFRTAKSYGPESNNSGLAAIPGCAAQVRSLRFTHHSAVSVANPSGPVPIKPRFPAGDVSQIIAKLIGKALRPIRIVLGYGLRLATGNSSGSGHAFAGSALIESPLG